MHIRKDTVASQPKEENKLPESALSICVRKTFFLSFYAKEKTQNVSVSEQNSRAGHVQGFAWTHLCDRAQSNRWGPPLL